MKDFLNLPSSEPGSLGLPDYTDYAISVGVAVLNCC